MLLERDSPQGLPAEEAEDQKHCLCYMAAVLGYKTEHCHRLPHAVAWADEPEGAQRVLDLLAHDLRGLARRERLLLLGRQLEDLVDHLRAQVERRLPAEFEAAELVVEVVPSVAIPAITLGLRLETIFFVPEISVSSMTDLDSCNT